MGKNNLSSSYDITSSSASQSIVVDIEEPVESMSSNITNFMYQHKFKWITLLVLVVVGLIFHFKYKNLLTLGNSSSEPNDNTNHNVDPSVDIQRALNNLGSGKPKNAPQQNNEPLEQQQIEQLQAQMQQQIQQQMQQEMENQLQLEKDRMHKEMENQLAQERKSMDKGKKKNKKKNNIIEEIEELGNNLSVSDEDINVRAQNLTTDEINSINLQLNDVNL